MRNALCLFLFLTVLTQAVSAQDSTKPKKEFKNTVRFNLTNPVLFGSRSLIFGYERILKKQKSFSINIGQASFPSFGLLKSDSLTASSNKSQSGFHISGDFRFYLSKLNKYSAPRGVYIGPYISHNYMERSNTWSLLSSSGGVAQTINSKTSLAVTGVGVELGYQFVFWDRLSLDMILVGPGVSSYKLKASLNSNLNDEDRQKFFDALNQALADKIPGYSRVIDEGEFETRGSTSTTSFGFRYMIMIGFRF